MDINRNNYEAFLLDLIEGRLSAEEQQAVSDFLLVNPDLKEAVGNGITWTLENSKLTFQGKEGLKKEFPDASSQLNKSNFDLFSIARLEGDLTGEQEEEHDSMLIRDEKLNKAWIEWQKTRLPAESVTFSGKDSLKKKKSISPRVIWISVMSSAAAVVLAIMLIRIDFKLPDREIALQEQSPSIQQEENITPSDHTVSPAREENVPVLLADRPVTLSIRKHQDPPELTGMKKEPAVEAEIADTTEQINEQQITSGPVQIARLDHHVIRTLDPGRYDRITPIDIPPTPIHLTSLSIAQLAELDLQEMVETYREENAISLWSIANAGIRGINRITGADMSLLASRDEEGDLSGIRFKSRRFSVATPFEPSE